MPEGKNKRVIVVETERHIRRLVEVNLQRAGYAVTTCATQLEALLAVRERRPGMIFLDSRKTAPGDIDLVQQLKADPMTADIPIMIADEMGKLRPTGGGVA